MQISTSLSCREVSHRQSGKSLGSAGTSSPRGANRSECCFLVGVARQGRAAVSWHLHPDPSTNDRAAERSSHSRIRLGCSRPRDAGARDCPPSCSFMPVLAGPWTRPPCPRAHHLHPATAACAADAPIRGRRPLPLRVPPILWPDTWPEPWTGIGRHVVQGRAIRPAETMREIRCAGSSTPGGSARPQPTGRHHSGEGSCPHPVRACTSRPQSDHSLFRSFPGTGTANDERRRGQARRCPTGR
jgi:hypothetical protein